MSQNWHWWKLLSHCFFRFLSLSSPPPNFVNVVSPLHTYPKPAMISKRKRERISPETLHSISDALDPHTLAFSRWIDMRLKHVGNAILRIEKLCLLTLREWERERMSMNYDIESDNNAHRTRRELTQFCLLLKQATFTDSESNDENEANVEDCVGPSLSLYICCKTVCRLTRRCAHIKYWEIDFSYSRRLRWLKSEKMSSYCNVMEKW